MRKRKNGFTFVELLAMLAIIGVLMIVTIPNISGMLKNQRLDKYKRDAISMVESAKVKANRDRVLVKPKNRECIVFSLNYLNDDDNIVKGPNGGLYDQFDSLVVYTRVGSKYKYFVRLVEETDDNRTGIKLTDSIEISSLKTSDVQNIDDDTGLTERDNRSSGIAKVTLFGSISAQCDTIKGYYSGGNYCTYTNGVYYDDQGNQVSASRYAEVCS